MEGKKEKPNKKKYVKNYKKQMKKKPIKTLTPLQKIIFK